MKLNWFTPLPPAQSGIAVVCGDVLPALARAVELTLWTDQESWDPALELHAPVRHYSRDAIPWELIEAADLNLYALGSNATFHGAMWQVLRRVPGIVILHDPVLFELVFELYLIRGSDPAGFVELLERCYGPGGRAAGEGFLADTVTSDVMLREYPCTAVALEGALGAIVHSEVAVRMMGRLPDLPIVTVPMPYREEPRDGRAWRSVRGKPPYRLIIFGHLGENRRLIQIANVLARHPRRADLRLDVYGTVANLEAVRAELVQLELDGTVRLHGFVAERELRRALECADLAINLRHPTRGEASHSQLMIWEQALPTLVTRADWCGELPEETVGFVRPEHEADDLSDQLSAFLAQPERFLEKGRHGRSRLDERHKPAAFVAAVLDLAARTGVRRAAG